jgi:hypothetical protein
MMTMVMMMQCSEKQRMKQYTEGRFRRDARDNRASHSTPTPESKMVKVKHQNIAQRKSIVVRLSTMAKNQMQQARNAAKK